MSVLILSFMYLIYNVINSKLLKKQDNVVITEEKKNEDDDNNPFSTLLVEKEEIYDEVVYNIGGPRYPGIGEVMIKTDMPRIVVTDKSVTPNKLFFDTVDRKSIYSGDGYTVEDFPVTEYLYYAVGVYEGWEEINGSSDVYMLVSYPHIKNSLKKFRVASDKSEIFGKEITLFYLADNSIIYNDSIPTNIKDPSVFEMEIKEYIYKDVIESLEKGNTVIIFPVRSVPDLAKKDDEGNYLSSFILFRK